MWSIGSIIVVAGGASFFAVAVTFAIGAAFQQNRLNRYILQLRQQRAHTVSLDTLDGCRNYVSRHQPSYDGKRKSHRLLNSRITTLTGDVERFPHTTDAMPLAAVDEIKSPTLAHRTTRIQHVGSLLRRNSQGCPKRTDSRKRRSRQYLPLAAIIEAGNTPNRPQSSVNENEIAPCIETGTHAVRSKFVSWPMTASEPVRAQTTATRVNRIALPSPAQRTSQDRAAVAESQIMHATTHENTVATKMKLDYSMGTKHTAAMTSGNQTQSDHVTGATSQALRPRHSTIATTTLSATRIRQSESTEQTLPDLGSPGSGGLQVAPAVTHSGHTSQGSSSGSTTRLNSTGRRVVTHMEHTHTSFVFPPKQELTSLKDIQSRRKSSPPLASPECSVNSNLGETTALSESTTVVTLPHEPQPQSSQASDPNINDIDINEHRGHRRQNCVRISGIPVRQTTRSRSTAINETITSESNTHKFSRQSTTIGDAVSDADVRPSLLVSSIPKTPHVMLATHREEDEDEDEHSSRPIISRDYDDSPTLPSPAYTSAGLFPSRRKIQGPRSIKSNSSSPVKQLRSANHKVPMDLRKSIMTLRQMNSEDSLGSKRKKQKRSSFAKEANSAHLTAKPAKTQYTLRIPSSLSNTPLTPVKNITVSHSNISIWEDASVHEDSVLNETPSPFDDDQALTIVGKPNKLGAAHAQRIHDHQDENQYPQYSSVLAQTPKLNRTSCRLSSAGLSEYPRPWETPGSLYDSAGFLKE